DGWANYGTASWAMGDTARAVAGWQRALRLEPLAPDVRDRVELAHGLPLTSAGFVPPVPVSFVAAAALVLWIGSWGVAAFVARRAGRLSAPLTAIVIAAGVLLLATFAIEEQLNGKHVGVVRSSVQLLSEPVLGSDRGANALVGEVVRVKAVRGAWAMISLDD